MSNYYRSLTYPTTSALSIEPLYVNNNADKPQYTHSKSKSKYNKKNNKSRQQSSHNNQHNNGSKVRTFLGNTVIVSESYISDNNDDIVISSYTKRAKYNSNKGSSGNQTSSERIEQRRKRRAGVTSSKTKSIDNSSTKRKSQPRKTVNSNISHYSKPINDYNNDNIQLDDDMGMNKSHIFDNNSVDNNDLLIDGGVEQQQQLDKEESAIQEEYRDMLHDDNTYNNLNVPRNVGYGDSAIPSVIEPSYAETALARFLPAANITGTDEIMAALTAALQYLARKHRESTVQHELQLKQIQQSINILINELKHSKQTNYALKTLFSIANQLTADTQNSSQLDNLSNINLVQPISNIATTTTQPTFPLSSYLSPIKTAQVTPDTLPQPKSPRKPVLSKPNINRQLLHDFDGNNVTSSPVKTKVAKTVQPIIAGHTAPSKTVQKHVAPAATALTRQSQLFHSDVVDKYKPTSTLQSKRVSQSVSVTNNDKQVIQPITVVDKAANGDTSETVTHDKATNKYNVVDNNKTCTTIAKISEHSDNADTIVTSIDQTDNTKLKHVNKTIETSIKIDVANDNNKLQLYDDVVVEPFSDVDSKISHNVNKSIQVSTINKPVVLHKLNNKTNKATSKQFKQPTKLVHSKQCHAVDTSNTSVAKKQKITNVKNVKSSITQTTSSNIAKAHTVKQIKPIKSAKQRGSSINRQDNNMINTQDELHSLFSKPAAFTPKQTKRTTRKVAVTKPVKNTTTVNKPISKPLLPVNSPSKILSGSDNNNEQSINDDSKHVQRPTIDTQQQQQQQRTVEAANILNSISKVNDNSDVHLPLLDIHSIQSGNEISDSDELLKLIPTDQQIQQSINDVAKQVDDNRLSINHLNSNHDTSHDATSSPIISYEQTDIIQNDDITGYKNDVVVNPVVQQVEHNITETDIAVSEITDISDQISVQTVIDAHDTESDNHVGSIQQYIVNGINNNNATSGSVDLHQAVDESVSVEQQPVTVDNTLQDIEISNTSLLNETVPDTPTSTMRWLDRIKNVLTLGSGTSTVNTDDSNNTIELFNDNNNNTDINVPVTNCSASTELQPVLNNVSSSIIQQQEQEVQVNLHIQQNTVNDNKYHTDQIVTDNIDNNKTTSLREHLTQGIITNQNEAAVFKTEQNNETSTYVDNNALQHETAHIVSIIDSSQSNVSVPIDQIDINSVDNSIQSSSVSLQADATQSVDADSSAQYDNDAIDNDAPNRISDLLSVPSTIHNDPALAFDELLNNGNNNNNNSNTTIQFNLDQSFEHNTDDTASTNDNIEYIDVIYLSKDA